MRRRSDGAVHLPDDVDGGTLWAGSWEVEPVRLAHGACWAVVGRGEHLASGATPAATCRTRAMAPTAAAIFSALAMANHLTLGNQASRSRQGRGLGTPLHDGRVCLGHVRWPDPRVPAYLHALRILLRTPESLALDLETLALLGRALVRRAARARQPPARSHPTPAAEMLLKRSDHGSLSVPAPGRPPRPCKAPRRGEGDLGDLLR